MSDRLKGKVAVITGSGTGVGKAIAIDMANEGAKVVTNNRKRGGTGASTYGPEFLETISPEAKQWILDMDAKMFAGDAETVANEIKAGGGQAVPFFGDVSDFEVARRLIQTAVDNFGKIDILVNNAGAYKHSLVWDMTREDWDLVLFSHLFSAFNCTRHALPLMMKQRWGRIINATSGARLGTMDHSNYSASKGGMVSLTKSVALEVSHYGITCNTYSPSALTRSRTNLDARAKQLAEAGMPIMPKEARTGPAAMEAMPGPESIAPFIAYLATDEAASITGAVFSVVGSTFGIYSDPTITATINKKEGIWTVDELVKAVPAELLKGYKRREPPSWATR